MERKFNKGDIVQHFKREKMTEKQLKEEPNLYLYEIIGTARHTENKEELMIYKPLYPTECTNGVDFAVRPLEMFLSEVDRESIQMLLKNIVLNWKNHRRTINTNYNR